MNSACIVVPYFFGLQRRSRLVMAFVAFLTFRASMRQVCAIGLCALLMLCLVPATGCSGTEVAQDIVNWTPALTAAIHMVDATGAVLAPAYAPVFAAATAGFDAGSAELVAQAQAYLANPGATTLQHLQIAVTTFNQTVNAALLGVARIEDPQSQQKALADIGAVATIVSTLLGLVASISSKAQIKAMAASTTIKVSALRKYLPKPDVEAVARHYHTTSDAMFAQMAARGF